MDLHSTHWVLTQTSFYTPTPPLSGPFPGPSCPPCPSSYTQLLPFLKVPLESKAYWVGSGLCIKIVASRTAYRRRQWHPTPVLLPGKSHGWRSLLGCSPCGLEELDTTERLPFHFSLSCTGEGNGGPLQCSCLENPRDGGAWWAAIYGVAQNQTRLK